MSVCILVKSSLVLKIFNSKSFWGSSSSSLGIDGGMNAVLARAHSSGNPPGGPLLIILMLFPETVENVELLEEGHGCVEFLGLVTVHSYVHILTTQRLLVENSAVVTEKTVGTCTHRHTRVWIHIHIHIYSSTRKHTYTHKRLNTSKHTHKHANINAL